MTEHDLLEVVEIEESSGLSRWGWEAYHAELVRGASGAIMLVAREPNSAEIFEGKRVIGFIAARFSVDEMHINNVAVREASRRRGVGSALFATALEEGARRGAREAFLEVRASNRAAQALYERHGFRVIGRSRGYYKEPTEDALMMSVRLGGLA
jgi:ribosomal-protein-alanine N-acetyltransferase